jgi:hypothetical protein
MTAMQEFVVPKSIPKTFAIKLCSFQDRESAACHAFSNPYTGGRQVI